MNGVYPTGQLLPYPWRIPVSSDARYDCMVKTESCARSQETYSFQVAQA
jgi:hypothetical protein